MDDIDNIIKDYYNIRQTNVIFAVYGLEDTNGADKMWTDYYVKMLPINGICSVTGKRDYIPDSYPPGILSSGDKARLFITKDNPLDLRPKAGPGYIASQKIIHALQYMIYGARNVEETESKYKTLDYVRGDISQDELKEWVDKNYPEKWDLFIFMLESPSENS